MCKYKCNICQSKFNSLEKYALHLRYHRNTHGATFKCLFTDCKLIFKSYAIFKQHIFRNHFETKQVVSKPMPCNVISCTFKSNNKREFCKHIYDHIRCGVQIKCPLFNTCKVKTLLTI